MAAEKIVLQRYHWYFKGLLVLITGALALTRIPVLIGLFVVTALWMLCVVVFALHNLYWVKSRRRYAQMTQEKREEMERGMDYMSETLSDESMQILNTGIRPENPAYQQAAKRREAARGAVEMHEQWRSELLGLPARSFLEVRRYWIERDPEWLARETAIIQDAEQGKEERRLKYGRREQTTTNRH